MRIRDPPRTSSDWRRRYAIQKGALITGIAPLGLTNGLPLTAQAIGGPDAALVAAARSEAGVHTSASTARCTYGYLEAPAVSPGRWARATPIAEGFWRRQVRD
ncbi:hypothetical protein GCM10017750_62440 [Streptomyces racemochromogenes]